MNETSIVKDHSYREKDDISARPEPVSEWQDIVAELGR